MKATTIRACIACLLLCGSARATKLFIPMDGKGQTNHLKAYGVAFAAVKSGASVEWLLNYKGGSFVMEYNPAIAAMCKQRKVTFARMGAAEYKTMVSKVIKPDFTMDVVQLKQVPRIAVYTPANKGPWDDAVTMALTYAEIPFDKVYVDEVLAGALENYDWLHLHHEDFTGQFGKFLSSFGNTDWYQKDVKAQEALAAKNGYRKVSQMQLAVVKKIRDFVGNGGNMFAMCSATDTYDIALAADGTDICDAVFDGDPTDKDLRTKLKFSNCFAFKDFMIETSPYVYEYSSIDNTMDRRIPYAMDQFTLYRQAAKFDPVPAMLCQNHTATITGFMGQTTAFKTSLLKPGVLVMADNKQANEARYIHGEYGAGSWTFYGGHDPEDYQHNIGDPATDLAKFPNSPGYRLILNNVLFPAAKKKIIPTVVYNDKAANTESSATRQPAMENRVKIFPNPSDGGLVVVLSGGKIAQVAVINTAGKEVYRKAFAAEKVTIDMKDLPAGAYMILVNGEYAGKVVKN